MPYEETLSNISLDGDATVAFYTGFPGMPGSLSPNWGTQYRFVKLIGAHQCGLATSSAATEKVVGVQQNKPQHTGEAVTVAVDGVSMLHSGGVIAAGDYLGADSTGRAVKVVAGPAYAMAVGSAAAADQLVAGILIIPGRTVA